MARGDETARVLRASEIGSYGYCAHAWWLGAVEGVRPDDMQRLQEGTAAHERHGRVAVLSVALTRLAYLLLLLSAMAGAGWLLYLLSG
jgi:hypothetical protein